MRTKILIVAAHPDDEVLGCGGTMARHAEAGDEVHVHIVAEGATSRDGSRDVSARSRELAVLRRAATKAAAILGACAPGFGGFPDNRMDTVPLLDVTKSIEALIARLRPQIVYTHHGGDLNIDHRVVNQAVATACRPQPGHCVNSLLFFEVSSSTEWQVSGGAAPFAPNHFVDVSAFVNAKRRALAAYRTEMRPWPHARSIEAVASLMRHRGASVGVAAAEAFMVGRQVVRRNVDGR